MNKNITILNGNVGMEPVLRTGDRAKVAWFTIAQNVDRYNDQTKQYEHVRTDWFNITAFNSLAERVIANIKKGDRVEVIGRIVTSQYEDSSTGKKRVGYEIHANDVVRSEILRASHGPEQSMTDFVDFQSSAELN